MRQRFRRLHVCGGSPCRSVGQVLRQPERDLVLCAAADVRLVCRPKQAEHPRPAVIVSEVWRARHDVEVHVRETLRLGELCDVSLRAASDRVQGAGQPDLPGAERCRLIVGQLGDGRDMPAREQHQPARKGGIEGVRDPPELVGCDALAHGQPVDIGIARTAITILLRCHEPNTRRCACAGGPPSLDR